MNILIAIPARNEAAILQKNILQLHHFCATRFSGDEWRIVMADSASTDDTAAIAAHLATTQSRLSLVRVEVPGKGLAIKTAFGAFPDADIFVFMDADIATDLEALPALVSAVANEGYDMAIGSRALKASRVKRSLFRLLLSRGYQLLSRVMLGTRVTDLPCGFKAIHKNALFAILPSIQNNAWFFDSEMTLLAEHRGKKIKEIPIIWKNPSERSSTVPLGRVIVAYIKEMSRLRATFKHSPSKHRSP